MLAVFFFRYLNMSSYCLPGSIFFFRKNMISCTWQVVSLLLCQGLFFVFGNVYLIFNMSYYGSLNFPIKVHWELWMCLLMSLLMSFITFCKILAIISSNMVSACLFLSFPSGNPHCLLLPFLVSLSFCYSFHSFFFLFLRLHNFNCPQVCLFIFLPAERCCWTLIMNLYSNWFIFRSRISVWFLFL